MSFKLSGVKPYVYVGVPEKDSGIRIPSEQELIEIMKNPKVREGIDRIEKRDYNGKPTALKMMVVKEALQHDLVMDRQVASQKKLIDISKRKHEGKL